MSALLVELDATAYAAVKTIKSTCYVCLGALQFERAVQTEPSEVDLKALTALLDHNSPGAWKRVAAASSSALQQAIQGSEHTIKRLGFQVHVSRLVALRSVALWRQLQQRHPDISCLSSPAFVSCSTPIKAVVKACCGSALAAELGCSLGEDDCTLCLTFAHRAEAAATEWLKPQGLKRKRGNSFAKGYAWGGYQAVQDAALKASPELVVHNAEAHGAAESECECFVKVFSAPVLVGGRYLKLKRMVPQSPWLCGDCHVGEGSVQEAIESVLLRVLAADSAVFIPAGREDIDVRMLGTGRPFVFEVVNPRNSCPSRQELEQCEVELAGAPHGVRALNLQVVPQSVLAAMKEGESEKRKSYRATCWAARPLSEQDVAALDRVQDLVLQQNTPVRVLHRRAPLLRERVIHSLKCTPVMQNPRWFQLEIEAQAGTYIKEFCHGDFGRTQPCVGELLGTEVQIAELDVLHVHLDVCVDKPAP